MKTKARRSKCELKLETKVLIRHCLLPLVEGERLDLVGCYNDLKQSALSPMVYFDPEEHTHLCPVRIQQDGVYFNFFGNGRVTCYGISSSKKESAIVLFLWNSFFKKHVFDNV